MNTLILSRQHPRLAPFSAWLGEEVVRTARLFTATNRVSGYSGFAEVRGFDDYEESGLVEYEAVKLHEQWPIDRILATSEADILRAGRLRSLLGLPGQGAESALAYRDKVDMKRRLVGRTSELKIPVFQPVAEAFHVIEFVRRRGLPVVVKPVDGCGSIGATVVRTEDDLRRLLRRPIRAGLEVEAFVPGDQYHVDGLVVNGEVVFTWPSKYAGSCLSFTEGGLTASHMLAPDNPLTARLNAAAREVVAILPTPAVTTFHLEIFVTPDDELYFCEIASRTGGNLLNQTIELAFGFNLNEAFLRGQAGLPIDVDRIRRLGERPQRLLGEGLVPPRAGLFVGPRAAAPDLPWVVHYEWALAPGARSRGPESSGDRVAGFILEYPEESAWAERLRAAWDWTNEHAAWESHE